MFRSHKEVEYKSARDYRRDLTGYVYADRMHKQEVLGILFSSQCVNDTSGHRERGYTRGSDHRVDLLLKEKVEDFREDNAARGIEYKREESESEYQQSFGLQELLGLHLRRYRYAEEDGDKICQHLLRRIHE